MRKISYELRINDGKTVRKPFVYSYGSTKGITVHLHQNAACIRFSQGAERAANPLSSSNDKLCVDAIKKTMLLHLLIYGKPLSISNAEIYGDGVTLETYTKEAEHPLVYSMIEENLDSLFPDSWEGSYQLILQTPKSAYDGRMNAVIALLLAKTQCYYSKKSLYLWMAMNGFYNYLTAECKKLPGCKNYYKKEWKQHELLCQVVGQKYIREELNDNEKNPLFHKGIALLKRATLPPDAAYASLGQEDTEFYREINELVMTGGKDGAPLRMTPYTFMIVWIPYQIRCRYFHNNQAMPLFMYSDEPLLTALGYTNYFLEQFLEEHLPHWMQSKELSEQQKIILLEADKQI